MLREISRRGLFQAFAISSGKISSRWGSSIALCAGPLHKDEKCQSDISVLEVTSFRQYSVKQTPSSLVSQNFQGHCRHCMQQPSLLNSQTSLTLSDDLTRKRWFSDSAKALQQRKAVAERKRGSDGQQLSLGQKVAQTSKDASYAGIIIVGIGVTALMFYTVGKELFSSSSPNGIYTNALKLCKNNVEIQDSLGTPIKGYGEMTRRKRRRHVSHLEYSQGGINFMRMKFYLEGPERKGTVHLEMKENESGRYEYRYLFVELDGYPKRTIILEDNR